ncbi:MAG TPA: hypothetical protein VFS88_08200 [Micavibrio sp.]|nr:hypothetical protein [Micavibrio sp.]
MFKKFAQAAAGLGIGVLVYQGLQNKRTEIQAQECVVTDTKMTPGMIYYVNKCNKPINAYACVKMVASDVIDIFSSQNSRNCKIRQVEPGHVMVSGNLYNEKAGWLWNATAITEVQTMACFAPKSPERTENFKFICK